MRSPVSRLSWWTCENSDQPNRKMTSRNRWKQLSEVQTRLSHRQDWHLNMRGVDENSAETARSAGPPRPPPRHPVHPVPDVYGSQSQIRGIQLKKNIGATETDIKRTDIIPSCRGSFASPTSTASAHLGNPNAAAGYRETWGAGRHVVTDGLENTARVRQR